MTNRIKLAFAAAIALIALSATGASAAEFSVANGGAVNATSSGKTTFTAGEATIACNLTLGLELSRGPIVKTAGNSVGRVRTVTWRECEGGEVGAVLALPWDLQYSSITGTLPEGVTSVKMTIVNAKFSFRLFFGLVNCLYEGPAGSILSTSLVRGTTNRYTSGALRSDETSTQRYISGPEACPRTGSMRGSFNLSAVQTITRT